MANAIATFGSKMPTPASAEQSDALAELEDAVQRIMTIEMLLLRRTRAGVSVVLVCACVCVCAHVLVLVR
eukprot:1158399-Pelagomonas_calceolata.AAC.4